MPDEERGRAERRQLERERNYFDEWLRCQWLNRPSHSGVEDWCFAFKSGIYWDLRVVSRGVTGWGWALFIVGTMLPLRFIYPRRHRRRRGCCYLESKNQCGCTHIAGSVDDRSKATTTAMVAEWLWIRKAVWWLRFHIWLCVPFDLSLKACMLFACQKKKRRDWMNNSLEQPKGECLCLIPSWWLLCDCIDQSKEVDHKVSPPFTGNMALLAIEIFILSGFLLRAVSCCFGCWRPLALYLPRTRANFHSVLVSRLVRSPCLMAFFLCTSYANRSRRRATFCALKFNQSQCRIKMQYSFLLSNVDILFAYFLDGICFASDFHIIRVLVVGVVVVSVLGGKNADLLIGFGWGGIVALRGGYWIGGVVYWSRPCLSK